MNNKITLYELLGLVKDGKAPKKIKFNSEIWMFNKDFNQYQTNNGGGNIWNGYNFNILNDTVEILEEQKKETKPLTKKDIEALGYACGEIKKCFKKGWNKSLENKPLEEDKKIPEKISDEELEFVGVGKTQSDNNNSINHMIELFADKTNEIIDYLESSEGNDEI